MLLRDLPIQKKLMRVITLIIGVVLFVTCVTFLIYEYYAFRRSTMEKLSTMGKIISANSTAALAFDNPQDAKEILSALKTEPRIMVASLYDASGNLFSQYVSTGVTDTLPGKPAADGYSFIDSRLEGFEPVVQGNKRLGTLYLKSNLNAMYERFTILGIVTALVISLSFLLAWLLSRTLQKSISKPILSLAKTAKVISDKKDYSVRAVKTGNDELGLLTDAFNHMLEQIELQDHDLNEFNHNLEQKINNRTVQLETVNKELEAFSYSVSHDLRAPLRGIVGFTTILENEYTNKLDNEAKRITRVIKENVLKMGNLIDDLLEFSRLSRQDILKTDIDTNSMVKEVVAELDVEDADRSIDWDIQTLPASFGDTNAIRQVWINLVSNAIKYSRNTAQPHIEIGSFPKDGQTVFFVKDNGVGFDNKYKDKLFKVFQRLHSTREFEGTGVGLAIIEKIISKHGGKVCADGQKDKGASFYFSLPLMHE